MAIVSLGLPLFHADDSAGLPLSGGRLYTYEAGTTTPLATYTDSTGGTPNANPIVLDSRGEAIVWLSNALNYKFRLDNAAGATLWTVDNIPAATNTQFTVSGNSIASAATITIPALGDFFQVTGTTTITGVSDTNTWNGREALLRFAGVLQLTHSASFAMPGSANITTAVDDVAVLRRIAAGTYRVIAYFRANGASLMGEDERVDVASATTTDIGAGTARWRRITGTTTITSFGTVKAGTWRFVHFADALTVTHNAASLVLPGEANITTIAGDTLIAESLGSGNWVVHFYGRRAGVFLGNNWQIDSTGRLRNTGNTQPAFSAYRATNQTSGSYIIHATERFDRGSWYDPATGIATCPIPGVGTFHAQAEISNTTGSTQYAGLIIWNDTAGVAIAQALVSLPNNTGAVLACSGEATVALNDQIRIVPSHTISATLNVVGNTAAHFSGAIRG